jgi:hypothetical protein
LSKTFILSEYELDRVLTAASPFHGGIPTKNTLLAYLTQVNGELKERREPRQKLYEHYVTAASLYACARHVVHLHIPEELPLAFASILKQKPYCLNKPFDVIMKREEDSEPETINTLFDAKLAELDAEVPSHLREVYTPSDLVQQKLASGLRNTADCLNHEYEQGRHLLFVTLWDICFPLFGMQRKASQTYWQFSRQLRNRHGYFCLKVPLCLAPPESSGDNGLSEAA